MRQDIKIYLVGFIPNIRTFDQTTMMYDKALCINLPKRQDRKIQAQKQFDKFGIDVEFYPAIENLENGMAGLHQTMIEIFQEYRGKRLLIFEDDVIFSKGHYYFTTVFINHLPSDFYIFYLGGNATENVIGPKFAPVRQVKGGFLTSHAILYSAQATEDLANHLIMPYPVTRDNTYDVFLSRTIQPHFKCYAAYPAIAHQSNGFSDICGFNVNYSDFHNRSKKFYE